MSGTVSVSCLRRAASIGVLALSFAAPASVSQARTPPPSALPPPTQPTVTGVEKVRGTADTATVRVEWDEPDLEPVVDWIGMPRTGFCYLVTEYVLEVSQGRQEYCRVSDDTFVEFDVSVPPRKRLEIGVRVMFEDGEGRGFKGDVSTEVEITLEP